MSWGLGGKRGTALIIHGGGGGVITLMLRGGWEVRGGQH